MMYFDSWVVGLPGVEICRGGRDRGSLGLRGRAGGGEAPSHGAKAAHGLAVFSSGKKGLSSVHAVILGVLHCMMISACTGWLPSRLLKRSLVLFMLFSLGVLHCSMTSV